MANVSFIHWNEMEAAERIVLLESAGHSVNRCPVDGPSALRDLRNNPPDVLVIDLTRLPSHGREVALAFRETKALRRVPIVFVGGEDEKIAKVRQTIPDAEYTPWSRIRSAIKRAIAHPPEDPIVPSSRMAGYSNTPLPKKLGIKPDSSVLLIDAPDGFETTLGTLPEGATIGRRRTSNIADITIWFVNARAKLVSKVDDMTRHAAYGGLWVAWPKKTSPLKSDVDERIVRQVCLENGLTDFKVCAIDSDWSGLRFTSRKKA